MIPQPINEQCERVSRRIIFDLVSNSPFVTRENGTDDAARVKFTATGSASKAKYRVIDFETGATIDSGVVLSGPEPTVTWSNGSESGTMRELGTLRYSWTVDNSPRTGTVAKG